MQKEDLPFKKILFVCINKRDEGQVCCSQGKSENIAAMLKARIKQMNLTRFVRVSKSGCQDVCAKGPNVMVFPDAVWYHGVTENDVERIVKESTQGINKETSSSASSV